MSAEKQTLTVVCPVYNESTIELFYESLSNVLDIIEKDFSSKILFVVDKSTDDFFLKKLKALLPPRIKGYKYWV